MPGTEDMRQQALEGSAVGAREGAEAPAVLREEHEGVLDLHDAAARMAAADVADSQEMPNEPGQGGGVAPGGASTPKRRARAARPSSTVWYIEVASPIGPLVVTSDGDAVTGVYMESQRHAPVERGHWTHDAEGEIPALALARQQLGEYFAGERTTFDVPLAAAGTGVQQGVWRALSDIPYGETRSYGAIARIIGNPKASRAVGAANGRNPVPIIVPCHRVIGSDGSMTGFGGGVERKQWLLAHEAHVRGDVPKRDAGLFE